MTLPDGWDRFVGFIIFLALTVVTFGFYPLYFWVTRIEEQTQLLRVIARSQSRQEWQ